MAQDNYKYGARVYQLDGGVVLVKQTKKVASDKHGDYTIDEHKERHVDPGPESDRLLGEAVRLALAGQLDGGRGAD